ncbi:endonuclease/exonuclease/phosphatase family protein [Litorisediminicola beolgyonensis]|uniref:Endonuclease/exonuclease/phosphatase family protein n=1 Tax=Litorisediminicola beolgyonensis TaxID=1173614 RepID=A0ABW3ZCV8_9RHOB
MTSNDPQADKVRIASYNLRKCVGTDWRRDPHRALDVIAGLGAQIVALQEADKRLGARPAALPAALAQARGFVPVDHGGGADSLGWHGNAILVTAEVRIDAVHRLDLPGLEPRGALIADLVHRDRPLRVVATHLGLRRRDRRQQVARIRDALAALAQRPSVILGDMNEWSPRVGLEPLADYEVIAPGRTFHSTLPMAALDRIALSKGLDLVAAGVSDHPLARRASDHLPIWAEITHSAEYATLTA